MCTAGPLGGVGMLHNVASLRCGGSLGISRALLHSCRAVPTPPGWATSNLLQARLCHGSGRWPGWLSVVAAAVGDAVSSLCTSRAATSGACSQLQLQRCHIHTLAGQWRLGSDGMHGTPL